MINGALLDINLAESVLSGATRISGAVNFVPADVRNKYPAIFTSKNTEFKQLKGSATISDGKARTDDLVVSAAEFETQGKGWFAFDHTVDLRALLFLSQQLSQDIISRAKETKNLANDQGRLEIPFNLSGQLPGAKPKPDVGYIARAMGKGAVERGLKGLFQKKSPKEGSETSPPQGQQPSESQEKRKKVLKTRSFASSRNASGSKAWCSIARFFRNRRFRLGFSGNQRFVLAGSDQIRLWSHSQKMSRLALWR